MTKWKAVTAPFAETRDRLDTITGVDKRAAECIIAQIGVDMSSQLVAGSSTTRHRPGAAPAVDAPR
ncbi:MAG TPA: hypothetical protein VGR26_10880 [Acidimicrobiales bacterium]|nr:hypothetical protein [Acidimicrobiales bacterium]